MMPVRVSPEPAVAMPSLPRVFNMTSEPSVTTVRAPLRTVMRPVLRAYSEAM